LSKLMSIGDELSDAKYKQGLLTERKEMAMQGAELTTERQRLEGILKALNSPKSQDADVIVSADELTKQVEYVVAELKAQGAILNRIVELSRSTRLGKVGSLYELTREPQVHRQGVEAIKQTVKYSLLGVLGGLFLGLFVAAAALLVSRVVERKKLGELQGV
jgi:hypothetical protein